MFCTESKSQSPNYSTRNLRTSSHILSLTVSSEAGTAGSARSKLSTSRACRISLVLPQCSEMPCTLWTLIKAAQAELSAWLSSSSSSTISRAHTELLSLLCRGHSCITDLLRNFLWDKGTKHGLCITPRSITKTSYLNYIWGLKKNANFL